MPKELTHWILAERAMAGLDEKSRLRGIVKDHPELYLCGAVLPDVLLHLIRGPHAPVALALAHDFHDTGDNSFAPLIRAEEAYCNGLPAPMLACLLGVVSHIHTDIVFHPFVFARSGANNIGRHYRLETAMDTHFIRQGAIPPAWLLNNLMNSPDIRACVLDAVALLFDPENRLPRHVLEEALAQHCRFQAMYDSVPWKLIAHTLALLPVPLFKRSRHLFYPLVGNGGNEFATDELWLHPASGEQRGDSIDDLADEAVRRMVATFERIAETGSLQAALRDLPCENLLTGLHGVRQSEMRHWRASP